MGSWNVTQSSVSVQRVDQTMQVRRGSCEDEGDDSKASQGMRWWEDLLIILVANALIVLCCACTCRDCECPITCPSDRETSQTGLDLSWVHNQDNWLRDHI